MDANKQGVLFQTQRDVTNSNNQSLLSFLKQRSVLLDAYESIRMIHDETEEEQFGLSTRPGASPEKWCMESWRVEACSWANIQLRNTPAPDNLNPIVSLCGFLSMLEVKPMLSNFPTTLLTELCNFMFRPLLQDVFVLSTVAKAMNDIGPCLPLLLKDNSTCLNPVAASIDFSSSASLFVGENIRTWAPSAVHMFANWLRSQSVETLTRQVLEKSASSSGVLRFLESLCVHSVPAFDSSADLASRVSPCWVSACNWCATSTSNHATAFAVAVILQETHQRTTNILEAKTYGMKSSPVSPLWGQILCGLRCCLMIECRRAAIDICFTQLVMSGSLPRSPMALLPAAALLSSNSFREVGGRGNDTLMNIIVRDRCSLDLLYSHQVNWARMNEVSPTKKAERGLRAEGAVHKETKGWPNPRVWNPTQSNLWSSLAFDQILSSEFSLNVSSNKKPLSSKSKEVVTTSTDSGLSSLALPLEWVPLAELFMQPSHTNSTINSVTDSESKLSRVCFHCHCAMELAKLVSLRSNELLSVQSLELAVAHVLAISCSLLPVVTNRDLVTKDHDKTVLEIQRHPEKKWYDFFDYDMPVEGYSPTSPDPLHDMYGQVLAAALSVRIFEDILFPEVQTL